MPGLGLRYDEGPVLAGDLAQLLGLLPGNVDGALAGELHVVEVEDLVVETLEGALGKRDEAHREIQARQPRGGLHQVAQMLEIELDVLALADSAHGGDQSHGRVGLDHRRPPRSWRIIAAGAGRPQAWPASASLLPSRWCDFRECLAVARLPLPR